MEDISTEFRTFLGCLCVELMSEEVEVVVDPTVLEDSSGLVVCNRDKVTILAKFGGERGKYYGAGWNTFVSNHIILSRCYK